MKDRLYPYSDANPIERLRWALDGDAATPVPLTRPMRKLTPVCRDYWYRQWWQGTGTTRAHVALFREIESACEQIAKLANYRYGNRLGDLWRSAMYRAGGSASHLTPCSAVFEAVYEAERETYRLANASDDSGGRARVRPRRGDDR